MESIPYSEVRAHLAETLSELARRDEPIVISRRGEPAAVLMSVTQYQRLVGGQQGFAGALAVWRTRNADWLAEEAERGDGQDPWAEVRDHRPDGGRPPFQWPDDAGVIGAPAAAPAVAEPASVSSTKAAAKASRAGKPRRASRR